MATNPNAKNWKEWLGGGRGLIVGKLGGISKNKWQWRVLNVDGENCTYCEPKQGAKLNTFNLRGATVRMVDNKSQMHKNFNAFSIESKHPIKKTSTPFNSNTFIAVLMPKDNKFVFMVEEADAKHWMMLLNQKEFPLGGTAGAALAQGAPKPQDAVAQQQPRPTATPVAQPTPVTTTPTLTPTPTPVTPIQQPKPVVISPQPVPTQQPKPVVTPTPTVTPVASVPVAAAGVSNSQQKKPAQVNPGQQAQRAGNDQHGVQQQGHYGEEQYYGEGEGEYEGEYFEGEGGYEGEYYEGEGEYEGEYFEGEGGFNEYGAEGLAGQLGEMQLGEDGEYYGEEGEYYEGEGEGEYYGEEGEYYGEEGEYYEENQYVHQGNPGAPAAHHGGY